MKFYLFFTLFFFNFMLVANASNNKNVTKTNTTNISSMLKMNNDSILENEIIAKIEEAHKIKYSKYITRKDVSKNETTSETITPSFIKNMAEKMQVSSTDLKNILLYSFINEWIGTRYIYGGTTKRGIDCSAYVRALYNVVYKIDLLRTSILQYRTTTRISKDQLKEGDLVFFNTLGSGVSHVGVYLQNGFFTQSSSSKGVGISSLNEKYWSSKFICGGRLN